jgi:hypothetical protein
MNFMFYYNQAKSIVSIWFIEIVSLCYIRFISILSAKNMCISINRIHQIKWESRKSLLRAFVHLSYKRIHMLAPIHFLHQLYHYGFRR